MTGSTVSYEILCTILGFNRSVSRCIYLPEYLAVYIYQSISLYIFTRVSRCIYLPAYHAVYIYQSISLYIFTRVKIIGGSFRQGYITNLVSSRFIS